MVKKIFDGYLKSGKSKNIKEEFVRSLIKIGPTSLAITISSDLVKKYDLKKGDILLGKIDSVIFVKAIENTL